MNKEYIVKHNLMEAHKQFMRLSEGYLATSLEEAGDENELQQQPDGDQSIQQDNNQMQQDMTQQQSPDMQQDMAQQMPQDMNTQTQGQGMYGQEMGADNMEPAEDELDNDVDDTVLDVEDLTQAQEKLNKKQNALGHDLGEVDDRIVALLAAVEKIKGSIDKNNSDIESLKAEFEKRVPTQSEKLNMQSLKMYPYNVSPNGYWTDKEKEGVYKAEDDDKKKEYTITQKDVDGYSDSEIEKSFDDELHQTMSDIFRGF